MKVWINKRTGGYSGGMILVAANNKEEAHEVFHADAHFASYWDTMDGVTCDSHYLPGNWEVVPELEYNGDLPCVIAEDGYTE